MLIAIDPGPLKSAYVVMESDYKHLEFGIVENYKLLDICKAENINNTDLVIEMIASYGMAVGAETFETVFWIGRFWQIFDGFDSLRTRIYRKDVKMNLCNTMRANDSNIRQALIDRFGVVGTKKDKGFFYGFSKDIWAAYAVGATYLDLCSKAKAV